MVSTNFDSNYPHRKDQSPYHSKAPHLQLSLSVLVITTITLICSLHSSEQPVKQLPQQQTNRPHDKKQRLFQSLGTYLATGSETRGSAINFVPHHRFFLKMLSNFGSRGGCCDKQMSIPVTGKLGENRSTYLKYSDCD